MILKKQLAPVAAAVFVIINVANVLSTCVANYWSRGDDYADPFACTATSPPNNHLYKEAYWAVQFPRLATRTVGFASKQ